MISWFYQLRFVMFNSFQPDLQLPRYELFSILVYFKLPCIDFDLLQTKPNLYIRFSHDHEKSLDHAFHISAISQLL